MEGLNLLLHRGRAPVSRASDWAIPADLILLSVVPILAGGVRLSQLASGVARFRQRDTATRAVPQGLGWGVNAGLAETIIARRHCVPLALRPQ